MTSKKHKLNLFGSFQLLNRSGQEINIPSKKGRALLALIATYEGGECSRVWAQELIWSRGSGSESLRRELSSIRKLLKKTNDDFFLDKLPKDRIGIDLDLVNVDAVSSIHFHEGLFLQGLELPHEAEFNRWLEKKRDYYANYRDRFWSSETQTSTPKLSRENVVEQRIGVFVQPLAGNGSNPQDRELVNDLIDRVCNLLVSCGSIDIYDFRSGAIQKNIVNISTPSDTNYRLQIQFLENFSTLVVNTKLLNETNEKLELLHRAEIDRVEKTSSAHERQREYVSDIVDQILYTILKKNGISPAEKSSPLQLTMDAVYSMFLFTQDGYDLAEEKLNLASELSGESSIYGWRALFASQKMDDPRVTDLQALKEEALYFAKRAVELDRYNPLTLSLVTHVYSFVLKDLEVASNYIAKAKSIGSDHIMTYDTDALLQIYLGNYSVARESAVRASRLGRHLPFRHLYYTSLSMIESLTGNSESAIRLGEKALDLQNQTKSGHYAPTIRYLVANYSLTGQRDRANRLLSSLPDNIAKLSIPDSMDRSSADSKIGRFLSASSSLLQ